MRPLRARTLIALALAPTVLVVPTAVLGERTVFTAAILLAEPLVLGLGLYLAAAWLALGRWREAFTLLPGLALALVLLHLPARPVAEPLSEEAWAPAVGKCSKAPGAPIAPIRVLQWDLAGISPTRLAADQVMLIRPDVAVFTSMEEPSLLEALNNTTGGEVRAMGNYPRNFGLYVRGAFQYCGAEVDAWVLDPNAERSFAALLFPKVEGSTPVPLLAFNAGSSARAASVEVARAIGGLAPVLAPSVVAVGRIGGPPSYRFTQGLFFGAGLFDAGGPPTWPARLGPLPFLTFHRMDRVFHGGDWRATAARTESTPGTSRPLVVELQPVEM